MITVLNPGTFTTVQDLGRTGFLRYGVPESGALDKYSLRCANLLLGNDEGMAGLEATLFGPSLKFNQEVKKATDSIYRKISKVMPEIEGSPWYCFF